MRHDAAQSGVVWCGVRNGGNIVSTESDVLLGLEEEVFITEPTLPSLASLWYLARLLWSRPSYYYTHSASNFARGKDVRQAVMSGVEVSTGIHANPERLVEDLAARRAELARVSDGLLVAIGHLFDLDAPSNTCGLHMHVGPVEEADLERVYSNLAHFLPLLSLLAASSPLRAGRYYGQSYRMACSYAIGPLCKSDKRFRFQDMIVSKRLGTIELRIFDPVWDLERVRVLAACIQAIARTKRRLSWDEATYAQEREVAATRGYAGTLRLRYAELCDILGGGARGGTAGVREDLFARTASDELYECWKRHGTVVTYAALDGAYRHGIFDAEGAATFAASSASATATAAAIATAAEAGALAVTTPVGALIPHDTGRSMPGAGWRSRAARRALGAARGALGLTCYYVPKLPYIIMKGLKEQ